MKTEIGCSDHLENDKLLSWWIVNLGRKPVCHTLYLLLISLWGKRALPLWMASKAEASEESQDSPAIHMPSLPADCAHVNTPFRCAQKFVKYPHAYICLTTPPKKTFPGYHNQKTLLLWWSKYVSIQISTPKGIVAKEASYLPLLLPTTTEKQGTLETHREGLPTAILEGFLRRASGKLLRAYPEVRWVPPLISIKRFIEVSQNSLA